VNKDASGTYKVPGSFAGCLASFTSRRWGRTILIMRRDTLPFSLQTRIGKPIFAPGFQLYTSGAGGNIHAFIMHVDPVCTFIILVVLALPLTFCTRAGYIPRWRALPGSIHAFVEETCITFCVLSSAFRTEGNIFAFIAHIASVDTFKILGATAYPGVSHAGAEVIIGRMSHPLAKNAIICTTILTFCISVITGEKDT
jgi:hypothetical protein